MPNFWTKAGQFISEKLSGSRTKDEDILKACEKMKFTEKGLSSLKTVLQNFITYSENFQNYFSDLNSCIKLVFNDSPFCNFTEEIIVKHQIIQAQFEDVVKSMKILSLKTSEWNIIFDTAKEQLKTREQKRKNYDHYEGKLSKLNKCNKKDQKYIERNEEKFTKAASEYVDISEKAFNTINNSLKIAYELASHIINDIINSEKTLFEGISKSLDCFNNSNERFLEIKQNFDNPIINTSSITYDPMKYMNDKDIMMRISVKGGINSNAGPPRKRMSNQNIAENQAKNNLRKTLEKKNKACGTEYYNNIYANSRMTNSFGELTTEELNEFYTFEDDF